MPKSTLNKVPWLIMITCQITFLLFIKKLTISLMNQVIVKTKTYLLLDITLLWFFKRLKNWKDVTIQRTINFLKLIKTLKHYLTWKKIKWIFPLTGGTKRNTSVIKNDTIHLNSAKHFYFLFFYLFQFFLLKFSIQSLI